MRKPTFLMILTAVVLAAGQVAMIRPLGMFDGN
jgi:hypothetical protein